MHHGTHMPGLGMASPSLQASLLIPCILLPVGSPPSLVFLK